MNRRYPNSNRRYWSGSARQCRIQYTNSTVAKFVLNDFENQMKNFVKVFPKDFKRVLMEKKEKVVVNR